MNPIATGIEAILGAYDTARREQLALCDRLEQIADLLPDQVEPQSCIHMSRAVTVIVSRAQKVEEENLFPALKSSGIADVENAVATLQMDHTGDICFAEELSEALLTLGKGSPVHSAETTGYMLRGFFESLRRHIAFEEQLVAELRRQLDRKPSGDVVMLKRSPLN